ncbi:MAG: O-antigen ligase family protein [Chloroflexota bacterium]
MGFLPNRSRRQPITLVVLFLGCAVVLMVSYLIAAGFFNYSLLVGGLMVATILTMVFIGRTGILTGFTIWILLFSLGIRQVHLTTHLALHPLMILIVIMFFLVIVYQKSRNQGSIPWPFSPMFSVFSLFWLWGWVTGLMWGRAWDIMLSEFLNFLVIFPIFVVTAYVLKEERAWKHVVLAFFIAGVIIAFLGATESRLSFMQSLLPGFLNDKSFTTTLTPEGFLRPAFAFFDTTIATIICALSVPMILPLWNWYRLAPARILLLLGLIIQLYGIYISGTRAAWLMVFVAFGLTLFLRLSRRNAVATIFVLLVLALSYRFIPDTAIRRSTSVIDTLQGKTRESSVLERQRRYQYAMQLAIDNPLGVGWGGAGWVGSDFIQVTANLGVVAGLLFLGWYISSLWHIWQFCRTFPDDPLVFGLFLCFVGAGINLAIDGVEVITAFAVPVWFVCAMVEIRSRQLKSGNSYITGVEHG